MKVNVRKMEDYYAQVEFKDVNYSFVNSVRRSLVSMVPCLAIHEIDFHMGSLGSYVDEESGEEISAFFWKNLLNGLISNPLNFKTNSGIPAWKSAQIPI